MPTFFHGGRRKIGVTTLVMACALMIAGVRSEFVTDCVNYSTGENAFHSWYSFDGSIMLIRVRIDNEKLSRLNPGTTISITRQTYPKWTTPARRIGSTPLKWQWQKKWLGFGIGEDEEVEGDWRMYLAVPYWAVVIPLTLLSAYLLLSKPRPKKPPEST